MTKKMETMNDINSSGWNPSNHFTPQNVNSSVSVVIVFNVWDITTGIGKLIEVIQMTVNDTFNSRDLILNFPT